MDQRIQIDIEREIESLILTCNTLEERLDIIERVFTNNKILFQLSAPTVLFICRKYTTGNWRILHYKGGE